MFVGGHLLWISVQMLQKPIMNAFGAKVAFEEFIERAQSLGVTATDSISFLAASLAYTFGMFVYLLFAFKMKPGLNNLIKKITNMQHLLGLNEGKRSLALSTK